jgi:hypothetical protein
MCGMDICEIVYVISVGRDFVSLEKGKGNLYIFLRKFGRKWGVFCRDPTNVNTVK